MLLYKYQVSYNNTYIYIYIYIYHIIRAARVRGGVLGSFCFNSEMGRVDVVAAKVMLNTMLYKINTQVDT